MKIHHYKIVDMSNWDDGPWKKELDKIQWATAFKDYESKR